mmetsp:Transcript_36293/g.91662  ORF Transcript_36293/g.91662 Transcript_36293/m.91662 type:complete len:118 (-) Transcript_36293:977-1330(-)
MHLLTRQTRMRDLLKLPDDYHLVFTPGGGSGAKSIAPLNFTQGPEDVVDILVNGQWSQRAATEAVKYARVNVVNDITADQQTQFDTAEWNMSEVGSHCACPGLLLPYAVIPCAVAGP